ncbi:MAG: phosphoenolpyruvate carboxykinase (ATP) [Euryarchaeota archaeon]|nr:phosphoenolpyruvate carboxykinase (ATP) [Euryarchaeota archaeon]
MIIFGLTATGKTTHSCHHHGLLEPGERVAIVQDDVVFLGKNGEALGTERGFYIKTDGLHPETQPLLYKAATSRDAILENIMVDYRGKAYFQDEVLTGNGRGIIQRDDLGQWKSDGLNLPPVEDLDKLLVAFITRRNTVLPIASKLTCAQAAGAFMLGESIESTGGDPKRAGESVRVVGTNPFIIGSEAEEGNWFYDFLRSMGEKVECYQLNTGGVGEVMETGPDGAKRVVRKVARVEILEMAGIIGGICRGTITWKVDSHFGTLVPETVDGVDMGRFDLGKFYEEEETARLVEALKKDRRAYLARFKGLHPDILEAYAV